MWPQVENALRRWVVIDCGRDIMMDGDWWSFHLCLFPNRNVPEGKLIAGWHLHFSVRPPKFSGWVARVKPQPD